MKVAIRGFARNEKKFEDVVEVNALELDELLPDLAKKHAVAMAAHRLHMIEIEFLDDPDDPDRFFRFGTCPAGMITPIKIDLKKPYQFPSHCFDPNCGAALCGSWTKHTPECEIGKLIRDFETGKMMDPNVQ